VKLCSLGSRIRNNVSYVNSVSSFVTVKTFAMLLILLCLVSKKKNNDTGLIL